MESLREFQGFHDFIIIVMKLLEAFELAVPECESAGGEGDNFLYEIGPYVSGM